MDFSGSNAAEIVNNADWFGKYSYLEFLRDIGKHFTVNYMMSKDSVKTRLADREHGISYTEFSYMILQAYDFYFLNKNKNCTLQIGGSDQWGNITAGCELIRRMGALNGQTPAEVNGLTLPLVTKSDGSKFGKTESGTIWLDAKKTSPYELYQFLLQTTDDRVLQYLGYFTFLSDDALKALASSIAKDPGKREAQMVLAKEVTQMAHGAEEMAKAQNASQALFSTDIKNLDRHTLLQVFSNTPSTRKTKGEIKSGLSVVDLLVESNLCKSKGAARKDMSAGGIYINNVRMTDSAMKVESLDLIDGAYLVIRKGKKNYHLISFS